MESVKNTEIERIYKNNRIKLNKCHKKKIFQTRNFRKLRLINMRNNLKYGTISWILINKGKRKTWKSKFQGNKVLNIVQLG